MSTQAPSRPGRYHPVPAALIALALAVVSPCRAASLVVVTGGELERSGLEVVIALPDGSLASSADALLACGVPPPTTGDLVVFTPGSRSCTVFAGLEQVSAVTAADPVLTVDNLEASTVGECLERRAVVFLDEDTGLRYCLRWSDCPALGVEIVGDGQVCAGEPATLEVIGVWQSHLWSPGGQTTAQITVTPSATTLYSVTVEDGEHCEGSASFPVAVMPLPTPQITGPTQLCLGEETVLDAGPGWTSWLWQPGGETTPSIVITPAVTTTYSVAVTDEAGCEGTSASHTVTVVECEPPLFADDFESGGTGAWSSAVGG